ncbi:MAG: hypothetical protein QOH41_2460 [Blastocatellia bacterium]|jgi:hypothetical protein|nr:hypothetical protein [Blastocatellia bacterium]
MKSTKAVTLIALFLLSFATVGYLVARGHRAQGKQGFTLYISQTSYPTTRAPILTATKIRYQNGDGSWKLETTYSDGRKDEGFGQPGRGVFHVDEKNQRLDYLSESGLYAPTEEQLRSNPGFVGEETILGYKTLHIHSVSDINSDDYADFYVCPALQGYPLRSVSGSKNGFKTILETTKVVLGESSFDVPAYPVDMGRYNQIHGTTGSSPQ